MAITAKLYALALSSFTGAEIVVTSGATIAASADEALERGLKMAQKEWPNNSDHRVSVNEIPQTFLDHYAALLRKKYDPTN